MRTQSFPYQTTKKQKMSRLRVYKFSEKLKQTKLLQKITGKKMKSAFHVPSLAVKRCFRPSSMGPQGTSTDTLETNTRSSLRSRSAGRVLKRCIRSWKSRRGWGDHQDQESLRKMESLSKSETEN